MQVDPRRSLGLDRWPSCQNQASIRCSRRLWPEDWKSSTPPTSSQERAMASILCGWNRRPHLSHRTRTKMCVRLPSHREGCGTATSRSMPSVHSSPSTGWAAVSRGDAETLHPLRPRCPPCPCRRLRPPSCASTRRYATLQVAQYFPPDSGRATAEVRQTDAKPIPRLIRQLPQEGTAVRGLGVHQSASYRDFPRPVTATMPSPTVVVHDNTGWMNSRAAANIIIMKWAGWLCSVAS